MRIFYYVETFAQYGKISFKKKKKCFSLFYFILFYFIFKFFSKISLDKTHFSFKVFEDKLEFLKLLTFPEKHVSLFEYYECWKKKFILFNHTKELKYH